LDLAEKRYQHNLMAAGVFRWWKEQEGLLRGWAFLNVESGRGNGPSII